MTRNLKVLGIALAGMLAMSAFAASTASAEATEAKFTAQDGAYPEPFTAANTAGNETVTTEAGSIECDSHFAGVLAGASQTVEFHPQFTGCIAFGFLEATVNFTGCNMLLHITTKTAADAYQGIGDLVCTGSNTVKVTAATCAAEFKPQTGLGKINFTNMTGAQGDGTLVGDVDNQIKYTVTKDGFLCPFGGTGNKTDGSYNTTSGAATVTSSGGIHIG